MSNYGAFNNALRAYLNATDYLGNQREVQDASFTLQANETYNEYYECASAEPEYELRVTYVGGDYDVVATLSPYFYEEFLDNLVAHLRG